MGEGFAPDKNELSEWLSKQMTCVVATNGENGYPNAATVAFSCDDQLEFFFVTHEATHKAGNIDRDSKVAITITNTDDRYTLQLEGNAQRLSWDEFAAQEPAHFKKLPFTLPFKDTPGYFPFRVIPTRLKFTDITVRPWRVSDIMLPSQV